LCSLKCDNGHHCSFGQGDSNLPNLRKKPLLGGFLFIHFTLVLRSKTHAELRSPRSQRGFRKFLNFRYLYIYIFIINGLVAGSFINNIAN